MSWRHHEEAPRASPYCFPVINGARPITEINLLNDCNISVLYRRFIDANDAAPTPRNTIYINSWDHIFLEGINPGEAYYLPDRSWPKFVDANVSDSVHVLKMMFSS